jgi:hypothetical protein
VVATEPAVVHGWSSFMASGAPGHGEAAPGDHLQSGYRLWLAGHQLEHARPPWLDRDRGDHGNRHTGGDRRYRDWGRNSAIYWQRGSNGNG